jgi:hypothetical protein
MKNHSINIGDTFVMSWGYDQTNLNFFQVTRVSDSGVFVREIASQTAPGSEHFDSSREVPVKDSFLATSQWCGGYNSENRETFRRIKDGGFNFKGRYYAGQTVPGKSYYTSSGH